MDFQVRGCANTLICTQTQGQHVCLFKTKKKEKKKRKEKRKSALVKRKEKEKKTKPALLCS